MATVGLAALVTLGFMLVPAVATLVLGATDAMPSVDLTGETDPTSGWGLNAASAVSGIVSWLAGVVVTGLIMRVVEQAVVGRRLRGAEAWRRSRGRLLPLLGLSILAGLLMVLIVGVPVAVGVIVGVAASSTPLAVGLGVLGGLGGAVLAVLFYVRLLLLAPPNLVIEGNGVLASMRRAAALSAGQFWRLFGIALLAAVTAYVVGQVVAIPFVIVGVVLLFLLPGGWGTVALLLCTYLSAVVTGAITTPFTGGVTALQYYDQRFRKEGHDIELLNQVLGAPRDPSR